MAFLTLSGISVPISTFDQDDDSTGTLTRTVTGGLFPDQIHARRAWQMTVPLRTLAEQDAYQNLITGRGQYWSFNVTGSEFSISAGGVAIGGSLSRRTGGPLPKFGVAYLRTNTIAGITFGAESAYAFAWTASFWLYVSSAWSHVMKTDDGTVYVNGSVDTSGTYDVISESSGTFSIDSGQLVDDLVILPYRAPAAWAVDLAATTQAFSALPDLRLSGDCIGGQTTTVLGTYDGRIEFRKTGRGSGGFDTELAATLREVTTRKGV